MCWLPSFFLKLLTITHKTNHHFNITTFSLPFQFLHSFFHIHQLSARVHRLKYGYS